METAEADIVMQMPSGTLVEITFGDDGVAVECSSVSMAESFREATEELRGQVSPADGDPNHATARLLAERYGATVVRVSSVPTPTLEDGQEIVY